MLKISKRTIAHLTRRQWARLWGQKRMIKPVFIPQALGVGDLLLAITPLNTRPNYYLIRVDARWLKKDDTETIYDHLDDIYDAIEDHVGPREWTDDNGKEHVEGWPALDLDSGTSWCDSMDLIGKKRAT